MFSFCSSSFVDELIGVDHRLSEYFCCAPTLELLYSFLDGNRRRSAGNFSCLMPSDAIGNQKQILREEKDVLVVLALSYVTMTCGEVDHGLAFDEA